jgi:multiple sugar transport system substrate-binding protein
MKIVDGAMRRRRVLQGGASAAARPGLAGRPARAQTAEAFNILAHRVHQQVATDANRPGGDVTAEWARRNNRRLAWITLDVAPIHDRLQRELSLGETSIDLAYAANTAISARLLRQLEPLEPLIAAAPLEDPADISAGMMRAVTLEGSLRALPIRHATVGLFYNEELLAERGLSGPPTTMEELVEHAQRLTYTRADGTPVHGFAFQGNSHFNMLTMAFGFDAPLIDPAMTLLPNEAGMVRMYETLRGMFQRGVLPRNFTAMGQDDVFTMIQNGRAAMVLAIMGRHADFNDPQKSRFPGRIKLTPAVAAASLAARVPVVATSDFWSMGIPRNSRNKALAWSLMRELSGKQATIRQALNGNGPVRASAYADPRLMSAAPSAAVEARVLPYARPPLPLFDKAQQAADVMMQTTQAVVIGQLSPADGVAELRRRTAPLLAG